MYLYIRPHIIKQAFAQVHWPVFFLVCLLMAAGIAMQYSASGGGWHPYASAQLVRMVPGFIGMVTLMLIPPHILYRYAYVAYGICLVMLVAVEVAGHIGLGAQRWVSVGSVTLQPSEFMKLATIVVLARYFHQVYPGEKAPLLSLVPPALLLAVPAVLILKQPNLGTATILCATALIMAFAAGVRWRYWIILIAVGLAALPVAWEFLHDYQKQRVMTFLNPEAEPLGAGYNIIQSMIAIGSGGMSGKGYLHGSQGQLDFLPEKQTDFIFTMLSEEIGFIGAGGFLVAYLLLLLCANGFALRCRHRFGMLIAVGVGGMFFCHAFINVGMCMGMLPVVGVPLPFLSYGGTILLATFAACGLLLNVWMWRDRKM